MTQITKTDSRRNFQNLNRIIKGNYKNWNYNFNYKEIESAIKILPQSKAHAKMALLVSFNKYLIKK